VCADISLLALCLLTYTEWVAPRSYGALYPTDNEPAASYVTRLKAAGEAANVHSPYSLGWWIGRVALAAAGDALENVGAWLKLCRYLSALLLGFSLLFFGWVHLRKRSYSALVLAYAAIFAWPTVWAYLHGYCAYYSFIVILGLPLMTICYWQFEQRSIVPRALVACGLIAGAMFASSPVHMLLIVLAGIGLAVHT